MSTIDQLAALTTAPDFNHAMSHIILPWGGDRRQTLAGVSIAQLKWDGATRPPGHSLFTGKANITMPDGIHRFETHQPLPEKETQAAVDAWLCEHAPLAGMVVVNPVR